MKRTKAYRGFEGAADLAQHATRASNYLEVCAACAAGDRTAAQRALRQAISELETAQAGLRLGRRHRECGTWVCKVSDSRSRRRFGESVPFHFWLKHSALRLGRCRRRFKRRALRHNALSAFKYVKAEKLI
jgi:uncharacterized protein (DUF1810 family)